MKVFFLIVLFFSVPDLAYGQTDTFSFVGKGIDTSLLKQRDKKEWYYDGKKCEGGYAIHYTEGFFKGRLDRVVWFKKGEIDSIVIYSLTFFSGSPTKLSILSKINIDVKRKRRYYWIFSSENVLWAKYQYAIINSFDIPSPLKMITLDQDIRFVDDGCQYNYHLNGKLKDVGAYIMGNKDGNWKYYDEEGRLQKVEKYNDNILISTSVNEN
ncbi:MAG TPA: hypothetical protein VK826_19585 [Bacteroidia bacterium]|nr:hypothetical protein [Bacteroidia bacterium]